MGQCNEYINEVWFLNSPKRAEQQYDAVIIGAGAAGLFCAVQAAKRGRRVLVIDHAKRIGGKILMSGGGRCNFTNLHASPDNFLSDNPYFCISALNQYTQWDFIELVNSYGIAYHEKTLGQLFCDHSAKDIVNMLLAEVARYKVPLWSRTEVLGVVETTGGYALETSNRPVASETLVVATGGLSMPKLGASPFGYQLAEQFGLTVLPTRAGLVPFTLHEHDKAYLSELSGVSIPVSVSNDRASFTESLLFTHRGISGPAILQLSSYWLPGEEISINLLPECDFSDQLLDLRQGKHKQTVATQLSSQLPKRFVEATAHQRKIDTKPINTLEHKEIDQIASQLHDWRLTPNATEGYRTAEVTLGGVDTHQLSSKTMAAKKKDNLFFIGEVVDVTGWLGGYNFQWAWSSGWVAGQWC